tara:strand:+ start:4674 stop:4934 length:261 start_codon:yes stop_codon:yes gene_type:complete
VCFLGDSWPRLSPQANISVHVEVFIATPCRLQSGLKHFEHVTGLGEEFGVSAKALWAPVDAVGIIIGLCFSHGIEGLQCFGFIEGN